VEEFMEENAMERRFMLSLQELIDKAAARPDSFERIPHCLDSFVNPLKHFSTLKQI
jgi:hypothetical protein